MIPAICHPDRKHFAKGKCVSCYQISRNRRLMKDDPEYRIKKQIDWLYWYQRHKEEMKRRTRERNRKLAIEVLTHYSPNKVLGCSCPGCDVKHEQFLTIDHIKGNGTFHIKSLGISGGSQFYQYLKKSGFPEGYQTLCYNCNCARGKKGSGGICPHLWK